MKAQDHKIYAEDVNFWQTSRSSPDQWMDKAKRQIEALGGVVLAEGFGDSMGKSAYMLSFQIDEDQFRIIFPVLPSKTGNVSAARRQAATMLYHYVKSVCLYVVVVGWRAAFFSHLVLPDGRVASQVANIEISEIAPNFLLGEGK